MKKVRFYDDNQDYLRLHPRLHEVVDTVWVQRTPLMNRSGELIRTGNEYIAYLRASGGWDLRGEDRDLADLLADLEALNEERVIVAAGLTETHIRDLRRFVRELPSVPKSQKVRGVVIFDWDEVLNVREGFHRVSNHPPSAYLKYAMGTKARLSSIRSCLDLMRANDVAVHIATNNTGCASDLFQSMARELHTSLIVHCCYVKNYRTKSDCITVESMIPSHLLQTTRSSSSSSTMGGAYRNALRN